MKAAKKLVNLFSTACCCAPNATPTVVLFMYCMFWMCIIAFHKGTQLNQLDFPNKLSRAFSKVYFLNKKRDGPNKMTHLFLIIKISFRISARPGTILSNTLINLIKICYLKVPSSAE